MTTTETEQAIRDLYLILKSLMHAAGIHIGDDIRDAMARLRTSLMTAEEHVTENRDTLVMRRSYLKPQRVELEARHKYLTSIIPKLDPKEATPAEKSKEARARLQADQAASKLAACVKELAAVEAKLAELSIAKAA